MKGVPQQPLQPQAATARQQAWLRPCHNQDVTVFTTLSGDSQASFFPSTVALTTSTAAANATL